MTDATTFSYTGNGTSGIFIWGAQLNVANAPVNLLTFSEQFDDAVWTRLNTTVTANTVIAPNGTLTADSVFESSDTVVTNHGIYRASSLDFTAGTTYTTSAYVKNRSGSRSFRLDFPSAAFSGGPSAFFDLQSGAVLSGTGATITNVGDGWYRCSFTQTATSTASSRFLTFGLGSGTTRDYVGDGTSGIFIWGAQLNTGSTALPYVATTSSIYLPPSYNSTTPKNLLGFTQEFDNAAWTKSNSFVQTNLVFWSEDVSNGYWSKLGGGTAVNSNTFNFTSTYGSGYEAGVTAAAGSTMTASVEVAGSGTIQICVVDGSGAFGTTATTITLTSTPTRYTVTRTLVDANAILRVRNISGVAVNGVTCGKMQLVFGSVPGDYQVTTSAAAAVQYSDPNGTRTADKLVEDTAASTTHRVFNGSAVTIPTTGPSANTIYVKAGERTAVRLTDNDLVGADFDLLTGAVSNIASGATATATSVGGGWWRLSLVRTCATVNGRVVLYLLSGGTVTYTGDGTSGIYVWGAQLSNSASVDSYVYNPQAAPTSTAYYGPRFDYNPTTLAANGLLIEQQSTNLFLNSSSLSGVSFSNGTRAADQLVAPDGTVTGSVISGTGGGVATWTTNATATGTSMTFTVYVKVGLSSTRNTFTFLMRNDTTGTNFVAGSFSTLTGAISGLGWTSTNVGNDWYRIAYTNSGSEIISVGNSITCYFGATGGIVFATTDRLGLWGAQLEAGSFATSYIPTVASQVTRAADNASMLGDNFSTWFNATEGTISSEASCFGLRAAGNGVVGISDGTTSNRFGTYVLSTNNAVVNYMLTGGVLQAEFVVNSAAANSSVFTSAFGYKANDFAASVNGGAALTDTSGSIATVNRLLIGNIYDVAATNWLNGWVRSISYYPTRLPNATLVSITA
jgi:predicted secreted protein